MVIKTNSMKNAAKIFGILPKNKIKVFAIAMLQKICFDSEKL